MNEGVRTNSLPMADRYGKRRITAMPPSVKHDTPVEFECECGARGVVQFSQMRKYSHCHACGMRGSRFDFRSAFVGKQFNRWTAIDIAPYRTTWMIVCRCECGHVGQVMPRNLVTGQSRGCSRCARKRHGQYGSPEYSAWCCMIQRCTNSARAEYETYGGRGIRVCDEWRGESGFVRFAEHMGPRTSPDLSVDRIDVNGNYEPGNVRWADRITQANNKRPRVR